MLPPVVNFLVTPKSSGHPRLSYSSICSTSLTKLAVLTLESRRETQLLGFSLAQPLYWIPSL